MATRADRLHAQSVLPYSTPACLFYFHDFTAKTHRRDAKGAENPENEPQWMRGAACGCVMREGIFLCERRVAVVKYCNRRDAGGAE